MKINNSHKPCPCGSGKPNEVCCGLSNVIYIDGELYNKEIDRLHMNLLSYATNNYEEIIIDLAYTHFPAIVETGDELANNYLTGLTFWAILHISLNEKETIFDRFYHQHKAKIKWTRSKNTFKEWKNMQPSVYEVLECEDDDMTLIEDINTGKHYYIPSSVKTFQKSSLLIGILVPYVNYHRFLLKDIELFHSNRGAIKQLYQQYNQQPNNINKMFPDFLLDSFTNELGDFLWNDSQQEKVAQLFINRMIEENCQEELISIGLALWHQYCDQENPLIGKVESYVAALQYLILTSIAHEQITQKQVAENFQISPGTVSTNYRKLLKTLENDDFINDVIYEHMTLNQSTHTEKKMGDLQKMLENRKFSSEEDLFSFIKTFLTNDHDIPKSTSPRDMAQDILFKARSSMGYKRMQLIEEALAIYPYSPDAFLLMAEEAESQEEYLEIVRWAVSVGEKDLGKAYFLKNNGQFWALIESRPYMRAKEAYAHALYDYGDYKKAIEQYEEMLRLNPSDNQGIRYILLMIYFKYEKYEQAKKLIDENGENDAFFLYNKILLHYLTEGITEETERLIIQAKKLNPHVIKYLLTEKQLPEKKLNYIADGDESEAIRYVQNMNDLWCKHVPLLKELKKYNEY